MSELGLSEILIRLDRLATSVQENGDRVSDRVIELDRKLAEVAETAARLEGTVAAHCQSDDLWRTEVSGRFQNVEFNVQRRVTEVEQRLMDEAAAAKKTATEAREKADASSTKRDVWRAQIAAVIAVLATAATLIGIITKVPDCIRVNGAARAASQQVAK